jgi:hypothetical protein
MNITPKSGPNVAQPQHAKAGETPREKAIAKLMEGAPTQSSNPPPQSASVEELKAISPIAKSEELQNNSSEQVVSESGQDTSTDEAKTTAKPNPLSTQMAQLARKERALVAKMQAEKAAVQAREEALAQREAAIKAKETEYSTQYIQKDRLKQDPMSVLSELEMSYDDITRAVLNPQAQQDPRILAEIDKLKAQIQEQRQEQENNRKAYEEQQQRAYQQAVAEIRTEATKLVATDPNFEAIRETKSVNDVVELIEKTYHKDGVLLSVEEAAQAVEDYLVEEAEKLTRISKIKSKLLAAEKAAAEKQQSAQVQDKQPQPQVTMKTLTNSVNASRKISSREKAIAAFKGEKI